MGNSFGHLFRITTWGESHGGGVGVVVDGCPPRLSLTEADIQPDLDRRRPGQSKIVTPRKESDTVQILSGTFEGKTLGTPISMWVKNEDARPEAYSEMATKFRPSHADYTYQTKYGIRNWQGGGRSSARETVGRVAAGAIAKKILRERFGVEILSYVKQVQRIVAEVNPETVKFKDIESNIVRCPDAPTAEKMIRLIEKMRGAGDSVGGIVEGVARGVPVGWGEPVFDKLEADLAKAMMSLPASKAFEIGSGFGGIQLTGREHNDLFRAKRGKIGHADQPFRGNPGRHLERRNDLFPRRIQARGHRDARAGDGGCVGKERHVQGPRTSRPLRAAARRADDRSDDSAGFGGPRVTAQGAVRMKSRLRGAAKGSRRTLQSAIRTLSSSSISSTDAAVLSAILKWK